MYHTWVLSECVSQSTRRVLSRQLSLIKQLIALLIEGCCFQARDTVYRKQKLLLGHITLSARFANNRICPTSTADEFTVYGMVKMEAGEEPRQLRQRHRTSAHNPYNQEPSTVVTTNIPVGTHGRTRSNRDMAL